MSDPATIKPSSPVRTLRAPALPAPYYGAGYPVYGPGWGPYYGYPYYYGPSIGIGFGGFYGGRYLRTLPPLTQLSRDRR